MKIVQQLGKAGAIILLVIFTSSCGTTTGLSPTSSSGGFDNSRKVAIRPHGTAPKSGFEATIIVLGAEWNEAHRDHVILSVGVANDITGVVGAELNIDGERISLQPTATVTDMDAGGGVMKMSTKGFVTPLDTVDRILRSKRTWIRIQTPTGTMENAIIDGEKDSKAYHALVRFIREVKGS